MKKLKLIIATIAATFISVTGSALNRYSKIEERNAEVNIIAKEGYTNQDLLKDIRSEVNFNYRILKTYNSVFNGYKISINENHIDDLKQVESVEAISHEHYYDACEFYNGEGYYFGKYNNSLSDLNIPNNSKRGEGVLIAVLDTGFSTNHNAFTDLSSSTNVKITKSDFSSYTSNKDLHAKNAKYFNSKIPFIYDYGGTQKYNKYTSTFSPQVEDDDPLGYSSHGMHVSSLCCANGEYIGVAPNAQLAFMKVFTDLYFPSSNDGEQTCYDSDVFEALGDAYLIGADVINLSLGSDLSEFKSEYDSAQRAIIDRLINKGVIVSVAAGNAGKDNLCEKNGYRFNATDIVEGGVLGSFAALKNVTSVASSNITDDYDLEVYSNLSVNGKFLYGVDEASGVTSPNKVNFVSLIPSNKDSVDIEYVMVPGLGEIKDYDGIDVRNKIAVVNRGTITFVEKIKNAKNKGAIGIIICNAEGCKTMASFDLTTGNSSEIIPTYSGSFEEHEMLQNEENKVITITREKISYFSSEGAVADLSFQPKISAPGNQIYAAVASIGSDNNSYSEGQGTSMAAPNYTGAVACILSDLNCDPKTLEARTMTTANVFKQGNGVSYSVRKQGAGLVDVKNCEQGFYLTSNDKGYIELKNNDDIKNGNLKFDVVIHNEKKLTGVYNCNLEVTIPDTALVDSVSYPEFKDKIVQTNKQQKVCDFNFEVNLDGTESQTISIDYSLTDEQKENIFKVFDSGIEVEGFLFLKGDSLPSLSIPFLGFIGDYDAVDCVEDFDFEKDENKLYQSQLAWSSCQEYNDEVYDFDNVNFGSCIAGNGMTLDEFNDSNIFKYYIDNKDDIQNLMNPIYGSYEEEDGYYHIYAGEKGVSSLIFIQQFVNRSIERSDLTLTNSKGEVVLNDHMFDSIYGSDTDLELYKSAIIEYVPDPNEPVIMHRAYTILDLSSYEEGNYLLKFTYELSSGTTQTRSYILEISSVPKEVKFANAKIEDNNLYLGFTRKITSLEINNETVPFAESINGIKYYKYDIKDLDFSKGVSFKAQISADKYLYGVFSEDGKALVINENLKEDYKVKVNEVEQIQEGIKNTNILEINIYDSLANVVSLNGTTNVLFVTNEKIKSVYDYSINTNQSDSNKISFTQYNGSIGFESSNSLTFGIVYQKDNDEPGEDDPGEDEPGKDDDDIFTKIIDFLLNNVLVGAIILLLGFGFIIALIVVVIVVLTKKPKH